MTKGGGASIKQPDPRPFRAPPDQTKPVRVFGFFSGYEGASAGWWAAGMEIDLGLDNDPDAQRTFEPNFPEAAFVRDDIADGAASALLWTPAEGIPCYLMPAPRANRSRASAVAPHRQATYGSASSTRSYGSCVGIDPS